MRLRHSASAIIFFYFDFNDREKQRHDDLIRSLILQLSTQSASVPEALKDLYSRHRDGQQMPPTERLVETLKEIIGDLDHVYIIIDALDECKERGELLLLLNNMTRWYEGKLRILATSRREKDIEDAFESLPI